MLESITSFTAVAQQAAFIAALTASSSIAFEAAVRGCRIPAVRRLPRVEVSLAHSHEALMEAGAIVREQYRGRGYHFRDDTTAEAHRGARRPAHVILARDEGRLVGTLTLGLDSHAGLRVEESHPEAVAAARADGRRLGELVRFAVREAANARSVLAAIFNAAHGLSTVHRLDDLYIEVNPRHVGFYRRALCFQVAAEERVCPRVGAPSVLMRLALQDLSEKIGVLETALDAAPR